MQEEVSLFCVEASLVKDALAVLVWEKGMARLEGSWWQEYCVGGKDKWMMLGCW